jgi:hypothetical protein
MNDLMHEKAAGANAPVTRRRGQPFALNPLDDRCQPLFFYFSFYISTYFLRFGIYNL